MNRLHKWLIIDWLAFGQKTFHNRQLFFFKKKLTIVMTLKVFSNFRTSGSLKLHRCRRLTPFVRLSVTHGTFSYFGHICCLRTDFDVLYSFATYILNLKAIHNAWLEELKAEFLWSCWPCLKLKFNFSFGPVLMWKFSLTSCQKEIFKSFEFVTVYMTDTRILRNRQTWRSYWL